MWINSTSGSVIAGNVTKDPEYKRVGNNNTPLFKLSVAIGKNEQGGNQYADVAAWGRLADRLNTLGIAKADPICVFGTWTKKECNGKTYWTLNADFIMAYPGNDIVRADPPAVGQSDGMPDGVDFGDMPDFMK